MEPQPTKLRIVIHDTPSQQMERTDLSVFPYNAESLMQALQSTTAVIYETTTKIVRLDNTQTQLGGTLLDSVSYRAHQIIFVKLSEDSVKKVISQINDFIKQYQAKPYDAKTFMLIISDQPIKSEYIEQLLEVYSSLVWLNFVSRQEHEFEDLQIQKWNLYCYNSLQNLITLKKKDNYNYVGIAEFSSTNTVSFSVVDNKMTLCANRLTRERQYRLQDLLNNEVLAYKDQNYYQGKIENNQPNGYGLTIQDDNFMDGLHQNGMPKLVERISASRRPGDYVHFLNPRENKYTRCDMEIVFHNVQDSGLNGEGVVKQGGADDISGIIYLPNEERYEGTVNRMVPFEPRDGITYVGTKIKDVYAAGNKLEEVTQNVRKVLVVRVGQGETDIITQKLPQLSLQLCDTIAFQTPSLTYSHEIKNFKSQEELDTFFKTNEQSLKLYSLISLVILPSNKHVFPLIYNIGTKWQTQNLLFTLTQTSQTMSQEELEKIANTWEQDFLCLYSQQHNKLTWSLVCGVAKIKVDIIPKEKIQIIKIGGFDNTYELVLKQWQVQSFIKASK